MKAILPIFACLAWALGGLTSEAQAPPVVGTPPASRPQPPAGGASDSIAGDALLRRVLAAVDAQRSIAARVRHKVDLTGREVLGAGIYLQQGRGADRQLRLELKLQTAGADSSVQQICDGNHLWIVEEVGDHKSFVHVDVARLRRARPKSLAPPSADGWLGLGGLPKLLAGLDNSFRFGAVAESRLEELRVWTIEGRWKPARLIQLLPGQKEAIEKNQPVDLTKLSPNVPDRVVLHVGCDDFFPYRIEYWRATPPAKDAKVAPPDKLLVLMELYEVRLGGPVDPQHFVFAPGLAKPVDRTQAFLDQLGLEEETQSGANPKSSPRR